MSRFVAWLDAHRRAARRGRRCAARPARMLALLGADAGRIEARVSVLPAQARAGLRASRACSSTRAASIVEARGGDATVVGRGRGAGQVALPVLEGDLRLRRAQPALARDDPGRGARRAVVARAGPLRRGLGVEPRSGRRSSAPTRSGSPSAPTRTRSSSRTWCATSPCGSTPMRASAATRSTSRTSSRSTRTARWRASSARHLSPALAPASAELPGQPDRATSGAIQSDVASHACPRVAANACRNAPQATMHQIAVASQMRRAEDEQDAAPRRASAPCRGAPSAASPAGAERRHRGMQDGQGALEPAGIDQLHGSARQDRARAGADPGAAVDVGADQADAAE